MRLWKTHCGTTSALFHSLSLKHTHAVLCTCIDIPPFCPSIAPNLLPGINSLSVNVIIYLLTTLFVKVTAARKVLALETVVARKVKNQFHPAQSWFCNDHIRNAFNDSISALQKRSNSKLRLLSLYYPLRVLFCHFCRSTEEVS